MIKRITLICGFVTLAVSFACTSPSSTSSSTSGSKDSISVNFPALPVLGANYVYEAWLIVDGTYVSIGTFALSSTDPLVTTLAHKKNYYASADNVKKATAFLLSIEPLKDSDPKPSQVKFLAGDFSSSTATTATVTMSHKSTFGVGFIEKLKAATVKATVYSPTDGRLHDTCGIWFVDSVTGTSPGITNLPELSASWKYEAWLVINGNILKVPDISKARPISLGTFTTASGADGGNPHCGTQPAPAFPGEDLLTNPPQGFLDNSFPYVIKDTDIGMISLEPNPDTDPNLPFSVKPFAIFFSNPVKAGFATNPGLYIIGLDALNPEPTGTITRTL